MTSDDSKKEQLRLIRKGLWKIMRHELTSWESARVQEICGRAYERAECHARRWNDVASCMALPILTRQLEPAGHEESPTASGTSHVHRDVIIDGVPITQVIKFPMAAQTAPWTQRGRCMCRLGETLGGGRCNRRTIEGGVFCGQCFVGYCECNCADCDPWTTTSSEVTITSSESEEAIGQLRDVIEAARALGYAAIDPPPANSGSSGISFDRDDPSISTSLCFMVNEDAYRPVRDVVVADGLRVRTVLPVRPTGFSSGRSSSSYTTAVLSAPDDGAPASPAITASPAIRNDGDVYALRPAVMPNFLTQTQLQEILTRGRIARLNARQAATSPAGEVANAAPGVGPRQIQDASIFGHENATIRASATSGGGSLNGSREQRQSVGLANVEAISPNTSVLSMLPRTSLFHGDDRSSSGLDSAVQPAMAAATQQAQMAHETQSPLANPTTLSSVTRSLPRFISEYNRWRISNLVAAAESASATTPPFNDTNTRNPSSNANPPTSTGTAPPTASSQPAQVADAITFDGEDTECTICRANFAHGEWVCRIQCRHVFHAECWSVHVTDDVVDRGRSLLCCPNCRGGTTMVARWKWIDHSRLTQYVSGTDGAQVDNQLDQPRSANSQSMSASASPAQTVRTPRSTHTDHEWASPFVPRAHPSYSFDSSRSSQQGVNLVVLPSTPNDYNDWMATGVGNDGLAASMSATSNRLPAPTPVLPADRERPFPTDTQLRDGRPAMLIDPGSVGNLGGGNWARRVAKKAMDHNRMPSEHRRDRPLSLSGVGRGHQECTHNVTLPIAMRRLGGTHSNGTFQIPTLEGSNAHIPGLLGLQSMRDRNAILDMQTLRLHFCGPGEYDLLSVLPPGTESFQCELAPSGHIVLPCCEYAGADQEEAVAMLHPLLAYTDVGMNHVLPFLTTN